MTTKITQTKTRLYQTIISEKNYSTISLLKNQKKNFLIIQICNSFNPLHKNNLQFHISFKKM